MKDSLFYLVQQLLLFNNISLDKKELEFQIKSHPSYPSLHSITGVLNHFNIDNLALEVPKDKNTLSQLPKSFLAQIHHNDQKVFCVVNKKGVNYDLIISDNEKIKLDTNQFSNQFTGILVGVEKTNLVEEKKNTASVSKYLFATLFILSLVTLFILKKPDITQIALLSTSIFGILISLAFKKQEQGISSSLGNAFCSGQSNTKDCNSVLNSDGAVIFKNLKLSDLSLIYFTGYSLTVLFLTLANLKISIPLAFSIMAAPITLYSIYYQSSVLKKWCLLCMVVVGILLTQLAFSIINFESIVTASFYSLQSVLITVFSFSAVFLVFTILSPDFSLLKELKEIKVSHFKFKRNFNVFNTLLEKSKIYDTYIDGTFELLFGSPYAALEIVVVTSPFCGFCKPVHTLIEDIKKKYPDQVKILVRFNADPSYPEAPLVKITSRLIDIYYSEGANACLNAMHEIYSNPNAEKWINDFGECENKESAYKTLEKISQWCLSNSLNFTPAILVNGREFPKEYDRTDLIYFIEDLNEFYQEKNQLTPIIT